MQAADSNNELRALSTEAASKYILPRNQWGPADEALYGVGDIFDVEKGKAEELRFKAIKYAFDYHYSNNRFYRQFCQQRKVKPDDIREQSDFCKIPLIPDTFFKDYPEGMDFARWLGEVFTGEMPNPTLRNNNPSFDEVMDALEEREVLVLFSSGTSGRFSFIPKDETSRLRQMYAVFHSCEMMPDVTNLKMFPLTFHPRQNRLFLLRVLGTLTHELVSEEEQRKAAAGKGKGVKLTTDMIRLSMGITKGIREKVKARAALVIIRRRNEKLLNDTVSFLEKCHKEKENTIFGGTPFTVDGLLSRLEEQGKKLDLGGSLVITGGGWKLQEGSKISEKDFSKRVEKVLGIPNERCIDIYGMVECSVMAMACEGHYKHIPHSILYPMVLDEDFKPLGYGEYGRYAFLDPLANSYPGFIVTGDRVRILESCPVCNRPGPVIEPDISRVKGAEDRGCGGVMRSVLAGELTGAGKED